MAAVPTEAGFAAGVRQMLENPVENAADDTALTEAVTVETLDGTCLLLWFTRLDTTDWTAQALVQGPDAATYARQLELYINCSEGFGSSVGLTFPHFDERLRHWCSHDDITPALFGLVQRMQQAEACPCGRALKPGTRALCSRCLMEGVRLLEHSCPICMQPLATVATRTGCCRQDAHRHCLAKTSRCFNCRHEPLSWT